MLLKAALLATACGASFIAGASTGVIVERNQHYKKETGLAVKADAALVNMGIITKEQFEQEWGKTVSELLLGKD